MPRDRRQWLDELLTGDGHELPCHLKSQINRELDRLEVLLDQIKTVEGERDEGLASAQVTTPAPALLLGPKRVGEEPATILWFECLYRRFANRRQVAAYAGLPDTLAEQAAVRANTSIPIPRSSICNLIPSV